MDLAGVEEAAGPALGRLMKSHLARFPKKVGGQRSFRRTQCANARCKSPALCTVEETGQPRHENCRQASREESDGGE